MRCQACDYALWNIATRLCPECGAPFRPNDYEFAPNSVQFCCPHCDQAYYGTDAKGHLVPVRFVCVGCDTVVHMDEMVVRPVSGVTEKETKLEQTPWLDRARIGRMKALMSMIGMGLVQPVRLMRSVPMRSSIGQAWWYCTVINTVVMLLSLAPMLLFALVVPLTTGPGGGGTPAMFLGVMGGGLVVGIVAGLVVTLLMALLWGASAHLILRMTGETAAGIGRTMQAILYSSGANITSAVPCFGSYFGWIWWLVSAVLMVKEGQRVHGGRASLACIACPALLLVVTIGLYAWFVALSLQGRLQPSAAAGGPVAAETELLTGAVLATGGPRHALELVPAGVGVGAGNFISAAWETTQRDVPVGDGTLDDFRQQGPNRQRAIAREAADRLPADAVAHRVGDFVFCHHGIDPGLGDPGLWIVIGCPDPDANPLFQPPLEYFCGRVDGTVEVVTAAAMPARLGAQNALRAAAGLARLPGPSSVTHDVPARAGDQGDGGAGIGEDPESSAGDEQ